MFATCYSDRSLEGNTQIPRTPAHTAALKPNEGMTLSLEDIGTLTEFFFVSGDDTIFVLLGGGESLLE